MEGSPYASRTDITRLVDDAAFVLVQEAAMPAASAPLTGDDSPLGLWAALAALSAVGILMLGKKALKR